MQYISKCVAGRATKIRSAVDAYGNPITFILSDDKTHNIKVMSDLIDKIDLKDTDIISANKGCDSGTLRACIEQASSCDSIPRKQNPKSISNNIGWELYKALLLVGNFFAELKHYRAVVTIFDKLTYRTPAKENPPSR